ncbi:MAG: hypothetical protein JW940_19655 [Polyangiaceae bacterium]|nr:hypothetical protein [Polyangiaceae bacterium]
MRDGDHLVRDPATGDVLGTIDELLARRRDDEAFFRLVRLWERAPRRSTYSLGGPVTTSCPRPAARRNRKMGCMEERKGPSIEIPADVDFLDSPGAAYADGKGLDLDEFGTQDPLAPLPFDDEHAEQLERRRT